jgi:Ca2+-binding RTX toxin-like protein
LVFVGSGDFAGSGNVLANSLTGGSGNDTLNGGFGADTLAGGLGDDSYVVDNAGDVVVENPGEGTDTVRTVLASYTLGGEVENLAYTGAGAFKGTGNAGDNSITGGGGADTLDGGAGADTLAGGLGKDRLTGGGDSDLFVFSQGGANGDTVVDFTPAADSLEFDGFGTDGHGAGATFTQIGVTNQWLIHDGVHADETITFLGNPAITAADYHFH